MHSNTPPLVYSLVALFILTMSSCVQGDFRRECSVSSDCADGQVCSFSNCVFPDGTPNATTPSNTSCTPSEEVCDGVDNDCDTLIDSDDPDLQTPLCPLQDGLCQGATQTCSNASLIPCDSATYTALNSAYSQGDELRCDNLDNNCDGRTDELCCTPQQAHTTLYAASRNEIVSALATHTHTETQNTGILAVGNGVVRVSLLDPKGTLTHSEIVERDAGISEEGRSVALVQSGDQFVGFYGTQFNPDTETFEAIRAVTFSSTSLDSTPTVQTIPNLFPTSGNISALRAANTSPNTAILATSSYNTPTYLYRINLQSLEVTAISPIQDLPFITHLRATDSTVLLSGFRVSERDNQTVAHHSISFSSSPSLDDINTQEVETTFPSNIEPSFGNALVLTDQGTHLFAIENDSTGQNQLRMYTAQNGTLNTTPTPIRPLSFNGQAIPSAFIYGAHATPTGDISLALILFPSDDIENLRLLLYTFRLDNLLQPRDLQEILIADNIDSPRALGIHPTLTGFLSTHKGTDSTRNDVLAGFFLPLGQGLCLE